MTSHNGHYVGVKKFIWNIMHKFIFEESPMPMTQDFKPMHEFTIEKLAYHHARLGTVLLHTLRM